MTNLICIVCPKGCHLSVDEADGYKVTGQGCPRGEEYGKKELQSPTRVITSTVRITGGIHNRLPVKTSRDIPKGDPGRHEAAGRGGTDRAGPCGGRGGAGHLRHRRFLGGVPGYVTPARRGKRQSRRSPGGSSFFAVRTRPRGMGSPGREGIFCGIGAK